MCSFVPRLYKEAGSDIDLETDSLNSILYVPTFL